VLRRVDVEQWTPAEVTSWLLLIESDLTKEALQQANLSGVDLLRLGEDQLIMLGMQNEQQRAEVLQNINDLKYYNFTEGTTTHQQDVVSKLNDCRTVRSIKVSAWFASLKLTGNVPIRKSQHLSDVLARAHTYMTTGRSLNVTPDSTEPGDDALFEATVVLEGEVRKGKRGQFGKAASSVWAILLEKKRSIEPASTSTSGTSTSSTSTSSSSKTPVSRIASSFSSSGIRSLLRSSESSSALFSAASSQQHSTATTSSPSPARRSSPNSLMKAASVSSMRVATATSTGSSTASLLASPASSTRSLDTDGLPPPRNAGFLALIKKKHRSDARVTAIPLAECAIDCTDISGSSVCASDRCASLSLNAHSLTHATQRTYHRTIISLSIAMTTKRSSCFLSSRSSYCSGSWH